MSSELELKEKKKMTLISVHGHEKEDDSAEKANEEVTASEAVTEELFVEEAATCEPEDTTNKDLDVKINNKQLLPPDTNVVFKSDSSDVKEFTQELHKAGRQNRLLQVKLARFFQRRSVWLQGDRPEPEQQQQQEYEEHSRLLTELKLQLRAAADSARQQAEELRLQQLRKLHEVEEEWRALLALKRDAAVSALSRRLGKEAARAKVQPLLTAEQLRQDELIKTRLKHFALRSKIRRLEAELREREERSRDPLQVQFERLRATRLEERKRAEKQSEETLKLQKKISSSLELLSNVKEKLFWSQMEVQTKRQQLTELEAMVATKKDLLSRTKQALTRLQTDNLRLNERRGLLGNRDLLRDFEDTLDASDHLEKHLEDLKYQQAQTVFKCGRWKKKQEMALINK